MPNSHVSRKALIISGSAVRSSSFPSLPRLDELLTRERCGWPLLFAVIVLLRVAAPVVAACRVS